MGLFTSNCSSFDQSLFQEPPFFPSETNLSSEIIPQDDRLWICEINCRTSPNDTQVYNAFFFQHMFSLIYEICEQRKPDFYFEPNNFFRYPHSFRVSWTFPPKSSFRMIFSWFLKSIIGQDGPKPHSLMTPLFLLIFPPCFNPSIDYQNTL